MSRRAVLELVWAGLWYVVLCFLAVVLALPLFWLVTTSLKTGGQTFLMPPKWIPEPFCLEQLLGRVSGGRFPRVFLEHDPYRFFLPRPAPC